MSTNSRFNPPPGWPSPPEGWRPPAGWTPPASWSPLPEGWQLWIEEAVEVAENSDTEITPFSDEPGQDETRPVVEESVETVEGLKARVALLEAELQILRSAGTPSNGIEEDIVILDDDLVLQSVGIYRYHHPLESSLAFQDRLKELDRKIAEAVKGGRAIVASNMFTFDSSLSKGRKMTADLSRLMLRAYNAEAENGIRSLRLGNVVTAKRRLERSRSAVAKLGSMMEMRISDEFHELRIEEIELTADWLMKKQEERESAREERARLREERRVQRELQAERDRLSKERLHLVNALASLAEVGDTDAELELRLAEIDSAIEHNDYRIANIRAGYVYVISNRGAFGPGIVKIGLTRRLEPLDRVTELGGASVPFRFDVHALFFSEDAVTLESELHHHFARRAVNLANPRKEFFFATPSEVREVLYAKVGNLLEFTEHADATEYLQSRGSWPTNAVVPTYPMEP